MFYKDIENWSQKKLRITWIYSTIIYLLLMIVAPIIIVSTKYNITKNGSPTKLTIAAFILIIFIAVFFFRFGKRLLSKLPQTTKVEQIFKFIILLVVNLMGPVLGLILVSIIKNNVILACDTISLCLYSIISGIVWDHLTIKFLEAESDLRDKAKEMIAVDKRIKTLKK